MRRYRDYRNSFAAGVLSKEFLARASEEVTGEALSEGLNAFVTSAGTVMRRCGSSRLFRTAQEGRLVTFARRSDGALLHALFYAGGATIYLASGAIDGSITGAPWAAGDVFKMAIVIDGDRLHVFSRSFFPRTVEKGVTWAQGQFTFRSDDLQRRFSPFFRFGFVGVTMQPGGYSGSVPVTFSAPVLKPEHVGAHFMYMKNQVRVTAVTSATSGTIDVLDPIYPSKRVYVPNGGAYKTTEIVTGDVTNVSAQVIGLGPTYVDVVMDGGYSGFLVKTASAPGEKLIGSETSQEVQSETALASPLPTNIWSEELISPARGYPATAALHRARMCISGFPEARALIATSARGALDDFELGAQLDRDAIMEYVGRDLNPEIKHLVSTEHLVILTDKGAWYVPEGGQSNFTPRGIDFDPISPDPCSDVPPVYTPEGVVMIDRESRVLLLTMTGTQQGAWGVADISALNFELVKDPVQLVYSSGIGGRKERVVLALNSDGTAASFTYRRGADQGGWAPWARGLTDRYLSFSAHNGSLFILARRQNFPTVEEARFDAVLDSEFLPSSTAFPNESLQMLLGRHVVGDNATDGSGVLGSILPLASVDRLGCDFDVRIAPAPLVISQAGRQRRRVAKAYVDTIDTGNYRLNGKACTGYDYSDDPEAPPSVGDREHAGTQIGSSNVRTILIEQRVGEGAPLHIRSITMNVAAR